MTITFQPPGQLSWKQIRTSPLPHEDERLTRWACRGITALARRYVIDVRGRLDAITADRDPFILVLNHNQRMEAVLIPTLLIFYRGGKRLHFMADWPMAMVPGVGFLYRRSRTILIMKKNAKPKIFNAFKRLFKDRGSAVEQGLEILANGGSLGIFPEGTINRDPNRMLRGSYGAAKLSILSGCPVIPAGIRFPELGPGKPIPDGARMVLEIGEPLAAPERDEDGDSATNNALIRDFHAEIMTALTHLSGKTWHPESNKRRKYV